MAQLFGQPVTVSDKQADSDNQSPFTLASAPPPTAHSPPRQTSTISRTLARVRPQGTGK
ncbi:hypothetical protein J6590_063293 [Homalodisca vitripennis]|nr:hypothetical protein J6590_063293 [Homalodisca vitripennis]